MLMTPTFADGAAPAHPGADRPRHATVPTTVPTTARRVARLGTAFALAGALCIGLSARAQAQPLADTPPLQVSPVRTGLDQPWDMAFTPDGALLFTEKCLGLSARMPDGSIRRLLGRGAEFPTRAPDLLCQGQSGILGVAVDPDWAQGKRFAYVYAASQLGGPPRSNRVLRVSIDAAYTQASGRQDIVTGIPFKEAGHLGGPGGHSGGRLRFGPDGFLWITTGDNHNPHLPQHPQRLGGKVLRVDRDGQPAPGNHPPAGFDPRIYTYGHRNPQGLAFRQPGPAGAGQVWLAEHGPNHSDEITALRPGGNGGWDPQGRAGLRCVEGYCGYAGQPDSMPMTDTQRFPEAMPPAWTNHGRSEGLGPAEFLHGPAWGAWQGRLAVAYMGARRLELYTLDAAGKVVQAQRAALPPLRLRSLVLGPDAALWAFTADGELLRITPGALPR